MLNVLIISGHPRRQSLCSALAESFYRGAKDAGTDARLLYVCDLSFDPDVTHPTPHLQFDEPDIIEARKLIKWADHIVFVYPTWWGTMPALLKGFIDRIFVSGFSFIETEGGTGYEGLLHGKSAQIITTMDTPDFVYKFIYRAPGHNALGKALLRFSGIKVKKPIRYGLVRYSDAKKRQAWIDNCFKQGLKLKNGVFSSVNLFVSKTFEWLKAMRLQFYPMTFIAYSAGAIAARVMGYDFSAWHFWLGYAWIFFAEAMTVFCNEYFDQFTDRHNDYYGPFNGGSRVLVTGRITSAQMKKGILLCSGFTMLSLIWLLTRHGMNNLATIGVSGVLLILATGYTAPPLRLSYRGLGELTVGLTHSVCVILCGYLYQGGRIADSLPWIISLPLFLSVLPSIILAGIPDRAADQLARKNSIAVLAGGKKAAMLAMFFTLSAAITLIIFEWLQIFPAAFKNILYGVIPHACLLVWLLSRYIKNYNGPGRIDGLIVAALSYLMWFALIPLINLM